MFKSLLFTISALLLFNRPAMAQFRIKTNIVSPIMLATNRDVSVTGGADLQMEWNGIPNRTHQVAFEWKTEELGLEANTLRLGSQRMGITYSNRRFLENSIKAGQSMPTGLYRSWAINGSVGYTLGWDYNNTSEERKTGNFNLRVGAAGGLGGIFHLKRLVVDMGFRAGYMSPKAVPPKYYKEMRLGNLFKFLAGFSFCRYEINLGYSNPRSNLPPKR